MRLYGFFLLLAFASCDCSAARGYFCTKEGNVLHYVRRIAGTGSVKWHHTMTINKVTAGPDGGLRISYNSDFKKGNGRQMYGGAVYMQADVSENGDVSLDMSETLRAVFLNIFKGTDVVCDGGVTTLPRAMVPGDVLPDIESRVRYGRLEYRMSVSARKVAGYDTLRISAGVFPCVVVSEHKEERTLGYNRVTNARTWYCDGIGMVRHDTYDRNMRLETSEVLDKIEDNK